MDSMVVHQLRMRLLVYLLAGGLSLLHLACSDESPVIAQVGEIALTRPDYLEFVGNLPPANQQRNSPSDRVTYLQSMVDQELLLLEADTLLADPLIKHEIEFEAQSRLAELFQVRVVGPQIEISVSDVEAEFVNSRLNHERLLRRVLVRTEEDMRQVLAGFDQGRDFYEIVAPVGVNDAIAEGDGIVGWFNYAESERRFRIPRRVFFSAQLHDFPDPIRLTRGWQIYSFVDERQGDLEGYFEEVRRVVYEREWDSANSRELELLKHKHSVEFHIDTLQKLFDLFGNRPLRSSELSIQDAALSLYTYGGDEMTLGTVMSSLHAQGMSGPLPEYDRAAKIFEDLLLRPALFALEATDRGWAAEPEFLAWHEKMHRKTLITNLFDRRVKAKVNVSDEEVKEYYARNKARFRTLPTVTIRELLAETAEAAEDFRRQLESGVDIGSLLIRRDADSHGKPRSGWLQLNSILEPRYPVLVEAAFAAEQGEWVGPLETADGHFAVFQVVESKEAEVETFDRAKDRVMGLLRQQQEDELIGTFISRLRKKYADRVVVYPAPILPDEES